MTKPEFANAMAVLTAGCNVSLTAETAAVWFSVLEDLPPDALRSAVKRVLCEREYPGLPPVGLLRRYATEAMTGIPETPEQAFERVRAAVSRYGWPDPAAAREFVGSRAWSCIEGIGGWERICDSPVDQRSSLFAQFRDAWSRASDRQVQQERLPEAVRPRVVSDVAASLRIPDAAREAV